ncbi:macro domain-containing protein [Pyramidobacter sp.]|uniref:macro domain-containing protein n=1 Tax=Pyramidobacter sp. TaxID=1943581 RepID=UPI002A8233ED|nr:macro domain-containing protein [Pyramidobacter sp.]
MKHKLINIKKSVQYSFSIIAGLSTIAGIGGYTIKDINPQCQWWKWGLIIIAVFIVLSGIIYVVIRSLAHKPYRTTINGKSVKIKTGDLFTEKGWKVIPFNDRYDTQVDDVIIAHNSLNGKMIDFYVNDLKSLNNSILAAVNDTSELKPNSVGGKTVFPLGRLIAYNDFLMLSFSHFDNQNRAYIEIGEYEQMLIRMWSEMRRVYAAKHIVIPLIGSGITTIAGMPQKNYTEMLKCILCTLRGSHFQPDQGISIVLTEEAMANIDMSIIKEEF